MRTATLEGPVIDACPAGFSPAATLVKQVLVLDDDQVGREMVEHALTSVGLDVSTAGRAVDAMVLARRRHFDLVIADYYLPDYPGTDFIRLLRQCDEYRNIPVILLTGRADELDRKRLSDELFVLLLMKGLDSQHLLTAVFKCMAAARCSRG